jgi:hypothetical protein
MEYKKVSGNDFFNTGLSYLTRVVEMSYEYRTPSAHQIIKMSVLHRSELLGSLCPKNYKELKQKQTKIQTNKDRRKCYFFKNGENILSRVRVRF